MVALQIGAKWTEGTGFTENGLIVDGRLTKIGRELDWAYDWDDPLGPWEVTDPGGQLEVVLTPRFDKHTDVGDQDLGSQVHQVFGTWSGHLVTDDGPADRSRRAARVRRGGSSGLVSVTGRRAHRPRPRGEGTPAWINDRCGAASDWPAA